MITLEEIKKSATPFQQWNICTQYHHHVFDDLIESQSMCGSDDAENINNINLHTPTFSETVEWLSKYVPNVTFDEYGRVENAIYLPMSMSEEDMYKFIKNNSDSIFECVASIKSSKIYGSAVDILIGLFGLDSENMEYYDYIPDKAIFIDKTVGKLRNKAALSVIKTALKKLNMLRQNFKNDDVIYINDAMDLIDDWFCNDAKKYLSKKLSEIVTKFFEYLSSDNYAFEISKDIDDFIDFARDYKVDFDSEFHYIDRCNEADIEFHNRCDKMIADFNILLKNHKMSSNMKVIEVCVPGHTNNDIIDNISYSIVYNGNIQLQIDYDLMDPEISEKELYDGFKKAIYDNIIEYISFLIVNNDDFKNILINNNIEVSDIGKKMLLNELSDMFVDKIIDIPGIEKFADVNNISVPVIDFKSMWMKVINNFHKLPYLSENKICKDLNIEFIENLDGDAHVFDYTLLNKNKCVIKYNLDKLIETNFIGIYDLEIIENLMAGQFFGIIMLYVIMGLIEDDKETYIILKDLDDILSEFASPKELIEEYALSYAIDPNMSFINKLNDDLCHLKTLLEENKVKKNNHNFSIFNNYKIK